MLGLSHDRLFVRCLFESTVSERANRIFEEGSLPHIILLNELANPGTFLCQTLLISYINCAAPLSVSKHYMVDSGA